MKPKLQYFKWFGEIVKGRVEGKKFIAEDGMCYPLSISDKFESCGFLDKKELKNKS